jgi:hypothetical protein
MSRSFLAMWDQQGLEFYSDRVNDNRIKIQ